MWINLAHRVRNIRLPASRPLLPLFEAVINSFQALEKVPASEAYIRVAIERERPFDLGDEFSPRVNTFTITDNGVGFDDKNCTSFFTSDSDYKLAKGGKGVGRFAWLKAFSRIEIESDYEESGRFRHRSFTFSTSSETMPTASPSSRSERRTAVKLINLQEPWLDACPRSLEVIARHLIEHFMLFFISPNCPEFHVGDDSQELSVRDFYQKNYSVFASAQDFAIGEEAFTLRGFRLHGTRERHHRLIYAAHYREVDDDRLEKYIPNLSSKLEHPQFGSFIYLGFLTGPYLDGNVDSDRNSFSIPSGDDQAEGGEASALPEGTIFTQITRRQIRRTALDRIRADLHPYTSALNDIKKARIEEYISREAPQYRLLRKDLEPVVDRLPPGAPPRVIDAALHEELYRKQVELKNQSFSILKEAEDVRNYDEYHRRLRDFMDRFNEVGKSALAQYVLHRRIVLELLDKALSQDDETGRYELEKVVHNIVFPMRTTSDDVPFEKQNLWIVDERLTYHSFLASDRQLRSMEAVECPSQKRPDIVIFDRPLVFSEDSPALHSIIIIEFKRPFHTEQRKDDPILQVFDMIEDIRAGKMKDTKGHQLRTIGNDVPAYAYIICDLTPEMEKMVKTKGAFATPDNLGYYGFNPNYNAYFEVVSYTKLLHDAKKRNRVLFDKLNIDK